MVRSMAEMDRPIPAPGRRRALPVPRSWTITSRDILIVLSANALIIVGMWMRHGGLAQLGTPAACSSGPAR